MSEIVLDPSFSVCRKTMLKRNVGALSCRGLGGGAVGRGDDFPSDESETHVTCTLADVKITRLTMDGYC